MNGPVYAIHEESGKAMSEKKSPDDAALKIIRNNIIGIIQSLSMEELHAVEKFLHKLKEKANRAETREIPGSDTQKTGSDRRRFRRIEMNLPIFITPIKTPDVRVRVKTCDISRGGVRFKISDPGEMVLGDHVELQMMLPDGKKALKVQSRVVRISSDKDGGCDMGVEYIYISNQDKERIERFTGKIF